MARALTISNRFGRPRNPAFPSILDDYAHLVERLGDNPPTHLHANYIADADDFNERAEHLRRLMTAVSMYVDTALEDIARSCNIELDRKYLMGAIEDATDDIIGTLENAAERIQGVAA